MVRNITPMQSYAECSFSNETGGVKPFVGGDNLVAQPSSKCQISEFDCKTSFSYRRLSPSQAVKIAGRQQKKKSLVMHALHL